MKSRQNDYYTMWIVDGLVMFLNSTVPSESHRGAMQENPNNLIMSSSLTMDYQ